MFRKTAFTLLAGFFVGLLFSPMSLWLLFPDSTVPEGPLLLCAKTGLYAIQLKPFSSKESLSMINGEQESSFQQPTMPGKNFQVAILTSSKTIDRGVALHMSWGRELGNDIKYYMFQPDHPVNLTELLPLTYLKQNEMNIYPSHKMLYLLQSLCTDVHVKHSKFVFLAYDNIYVQTTKLKELLSTINPINALYIGHPSTSNHYCMIDHGIILSQRTLNHVCPTIHECFTTDNYNEKEEIVFGSCVAKTIKSVCSNFHKEDLLVHYETKNIDQVHNKSMLGTTVVFHAVNTTEKFNFFHKFISDIHMNSLLKEANGIVSNLQNYDVIMSTMINHNLFSSYPLWPAFKSAHKNPIFHYDLFIWNYFNSSHIFQINEQFLLSKILKNVRSSINSAVMIAVDEIAGKIGFNVTELSYELQDGFMVLDESVGLEFILHISVINKPSKDYHNFTAIVLKPFHGLSMSLNFNVKNSKKVHLIIPVRHQDNPVAFLEIFETEFLQHNASVELHLVFFYHDAIISTKLAQIKHIYPFVSINQHELTHQSFSSQIAYDYVAQKLGNHELMVFTDINFHISPKFLDHCRMIAIPNKQAYSPIIFSYYKSDLVKMFGKSQHHQIIDGDSGYFNSYNFQIVSLYKSDYVKVGGFKKQLNINGGRQDIHFIYNILKSHVYLFRGVEPYVTRSYMYRSCVDLRRTAKVNCLNSFANSIGSKKVLGSFLIENKLVT